MGDFWPEPEPDAIDRALSRAMDRLFVPLTQGVEGLVVDRGEVTELVGIRAKTPRLPGAVGLFLDSLPPPVVVPYVTSARLAGMLERRGYELLDQESSTWVKV